MAIDRIRRSLGLLVSVSIGFPPPGSAQAPERSEGAPLLLINEETRVGSLEFLFRNTRSISESRLREQLALSAPGKLGAIRNLFAWLPFISSAPLAPFSPIDLQKDKVRLTRLYHREGFPNVAVGYRVALDSADNTVAVSFLIDEGSPLTLRSVTLIGPDGGEVALDPEFSASWLQFVARARTAVGNRLSEALETRLRSETVEWLRDHEHAFADLSATRQVDSVVSVATLVLRVDPGPRTRVGNVRVDGNRAIGERTIRRELPFRSGDPFRSGRLAEGQRQLFGLDLVRVALVDLAKDQPRDSTADVQVRIEEGSLRTVEGQLGYTSETGTAASATWSHRDFLGGARTMRASVEARTGWLGTADGPQRRYGASVTLRQPYLAHWQVSGLLTPFVEFRDDLHDRSTKLGLDATVVWERGPLRNVSANLGFSTRRVTETRGGALVDAGNFLELLRTLDTLNTGGRSMVLTVSGTWGQLDNRINPRAGWVARASSELTGPAPLSTVNYGRLSATVNGFLRLGSQAGLAARISAGRLFPFGRSIPATGAELAGLLRLRDVVFTAGGTDDVRGWSTGLLGPKVPDFEVEARGDSLVFSSAGRYVPLGGLARWTASVELQVPMPFVNPSNRAFGFFDGGQVSIPDGRFAPSGTGTDLRDDQVFLGTGAGIQLKTPAGPLRVSLGYKLNPSFLDLRSPDLVARAVIVGQPITSVPEEPGRRWKLHLSIGTTF